MAHARYEVRVNGRLSDRARGAFSAMDVTAVPTQTIVVGQLAAPSDLGDLLARCMAMGLEILSIRRLPGEGSPHPGRPTIDEAGAGTRRAPGSSRHQAYLNHRPRERGPGSDPDHRRGSAPAREPLTR